MSSALSMRLKKLERHSTAADPFTYLNDDELEALIAEVDRRIEAATGMPAAEYADILAARTEKQEPLPDGLLEAVVWEFITARRAAEVAHVQ